MTLLPDLQRELVRTAERRAAAPSPRPARRRPWHTALLAAAITATVAGTAGAVLVETGVVGGEPSVPYPRVEGEERVGMTRTHAPVVLGVATMPTVGRVEVVGYRMRGLRGRRSLLCVDLVLPNRNKGGGCTYGPPPRAFGVQGTGLSRNSDAPKLVTGAASRRVERVTVRYRVGGRRAASAAVLVRVPATVATRLDANPFVFFVAELPDAARSPVAIARDRDGDVAWAARFPG